MTENPPQLWTITEVAEHLGYTGEPATAAGSARKALHRWGVKPIGRQPGRSGLSLYDAAEVQAAIDAAPGKGVGGGRRPRTDAA
ncbi:MULTISPECIES: hypothetical protein [unclassified Streptomyces]|uniref:hypothetical protein n=1 Tax=unclassified Streptomyces TaxID=2593676 RepID=UPI0033E062B1